MRAFEVQTFYNLHKETECRAIMLHFEFTVAQQWMDATNAWKGDEKHQSTCLQSNVDEINFQTLGSFWMI